jgi:hypothetical protein
MTYYAHVLDMPLPAELYDAVHKELISRTEGKVDGLVMHVGRRTDSGFQVIEVWVDRESYERAEREVVAPIIASLAASSSSAPPEASAPRVQEFTPRGLVLPQGGVVL